MSKLKNLFKVCGPFFAARMREPSTYGGVVVVAAALGLSIGEDQVKVVFEALLAVVGAALAFTPDKKPKE